jgi:transposase
MKTGCQWRFLFVDIESVKPPFSWNTVYYFYRSWCKAGVFEQMFKAFLSIQAEKLDLEKLNLDGTHSLVKRNAESSAYQHRKRAKTSNMLIMTDGRGIPIATGGVLSGNHNDLFNIVPQFSKMVDHLEECSISVVNSIQNADKGFDCKALRRAIQRRSMIPNIIENTRSRKRPKRGRKRYFNPKVYKTRFVNERAFAWIDSFRTLLLRFDTLDNSWQNWHYLAFALILLKV